MSERVRITAAIVSWVVSTIAVFGLTRLILGEISAHWEGTSAGLATALGITVFYAVAYGVFAVHWLSRTIVLLRSFLDWISPFIEKIEHAVGELAHPRRGTEHPQQDDPRAPQQAENLGENRAGTTAKTRTMIFAACLLACAVLLSLAAGMLIARTTAVRPEIATKIPGNERHRVKIASATPVEARPQVSRNKLGATPAKVLRRQGAAVAGPPTHTARNAQTTQNSRIATAHPTFGGLELVSEREGMNIAQSYQEPPLPPPLCIIPSILFLPNPDIWQRCMLSPM